MHIAETKEQAYKDVEYGIEHWFNYFQQVAAFPQMAVGGDNVREMIDFVNESGLGVDRHRRHGVRADRAADQAVAAASVATCCWRTNGPTRSRPSAATS